MNPKTENRCEGKLAHSLQSVIRGYYDATSLLCSCLFVDPEFDIILNGFGSDGCGIPLTYRPGEAGRIHVQQNYGCQALLALGNVIVKEEESRDSSLKTEGKFNMMYSIKKNEPDLVQVRMSSQTLEQINEMSGNFFSFKEAIRVENDVHSVPGFQLRSEACRRLLQPHIGNLALMHPKTLANVSIREGSNNTLHVDAGYTLFPGEMIQGLESVFALRVQDWPGCASDFRHRVREAGWPSRQLVNDIMESEIYLVPITATLLKRQTSEEDTQQRDNPEPVYDWKHSFVVPEKKLFQSLDIHTLEIYHTIMIVSDVIAQACGGKQFQKDLAEIIKHTFLWSLELGVIKIQNGDNEGYSPYNVQKVIAFLKYLKQCLEDGKLAHYFIQDKNILQNRDTSFLSRVQVVLRDLELYPADLEGLIADSSLDKQLVDLCSERDAASEQSFYKDLIEKSEDTVIGVFRHMYKFCYMKLYASLHKSLDLDRCVAMHEAVQRTLASRLRTHSHPRLLEWTSRLISNSLAMTYLVKATSLSTGNKSTSAKLSMSGSGLGRLPVVLQFQASPKRDSEKEQSPPQQKSPGDERSYYFRKAEELLLMSNNVDLISGRVRLAVSFLLKKRYQEALDLLNEVISFSTCVENERNLDAERLITEMENVELNNSIETKKQIERSATVIRDDLLKPILERYCLLDLLFSEQEKCLLPSEFRDSFRHTKGMLLGIQRIPVHVYDPELFMRFLKVHTLIQLCELKRSSKKVSSKISSYVAQKSVTDSSQSTSTEKSLDEKDSRSVKDEIERFKSSAIEELTKLEELCTKEQCDMNEHRNLAYFNMVAKCYLLLGCKESAINSFSRSVDIDPNPVRNPAYFQRSKLQNEPSTGQKVKLGLGLAITVGVLATIFGIVKTRS